MVEIKRKDTVLKRKSALKVLVLGFDGSSPKMINKWIKDLPTFKMFKERGIFGIHATASKVSIKIGDSARCFGPPFHRRKR